MSEMYDSIKQA